MGSYKNHAYFLAVGFSNPCHEILSYISYFKMKSDFNLRESEIDILFPISSTKYSEKPWTLHMRQA